MSDERQQCCPLCGHSFTEETAANECRSCTLFAGCQWVRCPKCGYEWPREPRIVRWLRARLGFGKHKDG